MTAADKPSSARSELIRAVTELVASGGVRSVTVPALEDATGHGLASVHQHFGGQRRLLLATASHLASQPILPDPDPNFVPRAIDPVVATLIDGYRAYVAADPVRFAALLQLSSAGIFGDRELLAPLTSQNVRHQEAVSEYLALLHRAGLTGVSTADLRSIAKAFTDASHGIELCHLLEGGEDQRPASYAQLAATLKARLLNIPSTGDPTRAVAPTPPSEARISLALAPDYRFVMVLEPDGVVRDLLYVEGIRGLDARACIGHPVTDVAARGPRGRRQGDEWVRRLEHARRQPGPARYEEAYPSGEAGSVITLVTPIRNANGELESILVDIEDRSARATAQATADLHTEQLRNALEVAQLGTFVAYFREPLIVSNARFGEIYGRDTQALMLEKGIGVFIDLIHSEDRQSVRETLADAATRGSDYGVSYRLWAETPDGPTLRWINGNGRVERDAHGPWRLLGVIEDVTERRKQLEALLLSQKREAMGTLAAGVAHDFNNVLSSVLGNAKAARRQIAEGKPADENIGEIEAGARRAAELVNHLLAFSHSDRPPRERYSASATIHAACSLIRPTLGVGVELHESIAPSLPSLIGDPSGLHQVILNLVVNADSAFGDGPGRIDITVDQERLDQSPPGADAPLEAGDYIRIRVQDDGPGIRADAADRAFDPFFGGQAGRAGAGLGLAAARAVVHDHGGAISLDSDAQRGALFTIHLPVASNESAVRPTAPTAPAASVPSTPVRVLFVDDERSLTKLATREMPGHGCDVVTSNDPLAAFDLFRADPTAFDAVITDLSMPRMNGLRFARRIRILASTIPIVLSSGFITDEARAEAARIGIHRIVPKPCTIDALAAAVLELVVRPQEPPAII